MPCQSPQTLALLAGSPAIGAGDSAVCNSTSTPPGAAVGGKDQRGFPRPTTTCSIGAFEAIQTYTIGSNSDTSAAATLAQCLDPNNTTCRLRDAIGDATSGSDTIVFNNTGRGTITVGSTLTLASSMTITGPTSGVSVTVEAATRPHTATYGVFTVNSGVTATISALTIANGNSAGNGGDIFNDGGTLTVTNSTLSGNSALFGGGIFNVGTLTVTNSTLSGNSAFESGGIFNDGGTLTVTNSTFSGNSASNAVGGIFNNSGTVNLTNTIVAGNSNGDLGGTPAATTSHTLIGGTPLLAPLGAYGGPTQTVALLPGSPAIDAGDDTACTSTGPACVNNKDQRGVTRSVGAHCDIGAFESRGFILARTSGDSQSAPVNTVFTNPLVVTVTARFAGEPVEGGIVTFTGPPSGAGIVTSPVMATITGGQARITPTANGIPGGYYPVSAAVAAVRRRLPSPSRSPMPMRPSPGSARHPARRRAAIVSRSAARDSARQRIPSCRWRGWRCR